MYFEGKSQIKDFIDTVADKVKLAGWTVTKIPVGLGGNSVLTTSASSITPFVFSSDMTNPLNTLTSMNEDCGYKSVDSGSYMQVTIDTSANKGYLVNGMALTSSYSATYNDNLPDSYQLFGSDNNSTWTELSAKTDLTFDGYKAREVLYTSNQTEYRYYQIRMYNDKSATRTMYIQLVEFLEDINNTNYYGYVLESNGSSGIDNVVIYLNNGLGKTLDTNCFYYGALKAFNRVTHKMSLVSCAYSRYYATTTAYPNTNMLTYYMSVSADRIVLSHCTESYLPAPSNQVVYLGLMDRFSSETDNGAVCRMATNGNLYSNAVVTLSSMAGFHRGKGTVLWVYPTKSPSLWGDKVFMSPAFIEMENEGVRGSLDGIYLSKIDGMVHGDEVVIGASKYKFIITTSYENSALPTRGVLIAME